MLAMKSSLGDETRTRKLRSHCALLKQGSMRLDTLSLGCTSKLHKVFTPAALFPLPLYYGHKISHLPGTASLAPFYAVPLG